MAESKTSQKSDASSAVPTKEELERLHAANVMAKVEQATRHMGVEQERTKALIAELSSRHVTEQSVRNAVKAIRELAAAGETEVMLLRFPNEMCTDGGRAINNSESDWPRTLTGFPLEIYNKWQETFRDQGYRLTAKILEFPGGMPGDVGMFMGWG
jgi:hypothetical protein